MTGHDIALYPHLGVKGGKRCLACPDLSGRSPSCPTCDTALVYRRWFLNRDGWWCPCCYAWCKPVAVTAPARTPSPGESSGTK